MNSPASTRSAQLQRAQGDVSAESRHGDDLLVSIAPFNFGRWTGSWAQLQDEGLLPPELAQPPGTVAAVWTLGPVRFSINRVRPPEFKGCGRGWMLGDYWALTTSVFGGEDGWSKARELELLAELKQLKDRLTPEGRRRLDGQNRAYTAARRDLAFAAFKERLLPGDRRAWRSW